METIILACMELMLLSATGLLAIWGGLGRLHWFVRAVVVLGGLLLWLVVPAYEPVLVFFTQATVAVLPLAWVRWWRARVPEGEGDGAESTMARWFPQFSLRDLLLVTVVVAVVSAVAAQVTADVWNSWWRLALFGGVYGLLTVLAAWVALGRCRWWLRAIGGCLGLPSVLMIGWILLARSSGLFGGKPSARATLRYATRVGALAVSLLILLPSAFAYYWLLTPTPIPVTVMPDPNGHDDLMRAGKSFAHVGAVPERAGGVGALRSFVQTHAPTLKVARTGLDRECQVRVRYDTDDFVLKNLQCLRGLLRAFRAEAFLAEAEGRTEDAMRSHYTNVRLGHAGARGGLLVDRLIGSTIKGIGISGLNDLSGALSAQQGRELIEILETPEADWEPLEDCLTRDKAWQDHAFGWQGRLFDMIWSLADGDTAPWKPARSAYLRYEARKRLLIVKLAIRCYRLERAELPNTLADLVPEYLPAVPEDPFSGKPLIYRCVGDGHVLYSVGEDGLDDGGHRADPKDPFGVDKDLLLNTPASSG